MISTINSNIVSYTSSVNSIAPKTDQSSQTQRVDPNSAEYKAKDKSKVESSTRDNMLSLINRFSGDNDTMENLLSNYSKPDLLGPVLGGLPDPSDPQAMERASRMSSLFRSEQTDVEKQKSELISIGRANGKSAGEILNDIVGLYDSQSDFFKTGIGWNGDVFAFDSSSPAGLARTQSYISDPINIRA
jgi:hypothetical protein